MANSTNAVAARAIFVSGLLPGDRNAPHLSQQKAIALEQHLTRTLNVCTSKNIQLCKNSIINYVLPSPTRTAALLKYLLALSRSSVPRPADYTVSEMMVGLDIELIGLEAKDGKRLPPKSAARRLHVVYIVHDILMTLHGWQNSSQPPARLRGVDLSATLDKLRSHIISLVQLAACRGEFSGDEVSQPLQRLVALWKASQVFTDEQIQTLNSLANSCQERTWKQALEEAAREDDKRTAEERRAKEEAHKWILPVRHGVKNDPEAPWYELPAANGLYMKSTRGYPLRAGAFPKGGYELKYGGQEADSSLQRDVSWLHSEMLHCFESHTNAEEVQDVDPLGNKIWKDPERPTRNYWGFTYEGLEKAKENARMFRDKATGYDDVAPLRPEPGSMDEVDTAIARARALAGGRGGFDNRGGRGRGGRGGGNWRGPPRGGNGYRGGRGYY